MIQINLVCPSIYALALYILGNIVFKIAINDKINAPEAKNS